MAPGPDFFISYANDANDPRWAEWIAETLTDAGYECRLQAWDFAPGTNLVLAMNEYVRDAKRLIMVLSPAYIGDRPMVNAEWSAKFIEDADGKGRLLIPVRVRSCEVRGLLGPRVYVDLVGKTETEARRDLLDAVQPGRRRPASAPFPGIT